MSVFGDYAVVRRKSQGIGSTMQMKQSERKWIHTLKKISVVICILLAGICIADIVFTSMRLGQIRILLIFELILAVLLLAGTLAVRNTTVRLLTGLLLSAALLVCCAADLPQTLVMHSLAIPFPLIAAVLRSALSLCCMVLFPFRAAAGCFQRG